MKRKNSMYVYMYEQYIYKCCDLYFNSLFNETREKLVNCAKRKW